MLDQLCAALATPQVLAAVLAPIIPTLAAGVIAWRLAENYKAQIRTREQAAKLGEYVAYFYEISSTRVQPEQWVKINTLAFELALWLPEHLYRDLLQAQKTRNALKGKNVFAVLLKVREYLTGKSTTLTDDDILFHAPNAEALMRPRPPT